MHLYNNEDMHNYTILLNWENERASIQFNVLKLNPPSTSYFGKSPNMDSPTPSKTKKKNPVI